MENTKKILRRIEKQKKLLEEKIKQTGSKK